MGPGAFMVGLLGAGAIFLVAAISAAASIAFFLPRQPAAYLRSLLEWAAGLSGAGYVAVVLTWQQFGWGSGPSQPAVTMLLGVTAAASYLPLSILLLLQAIEPQWATLPAGRALGLSLPRAAVSSLQVASGSLKSALFLYSARLLADASAFALIYSKGLGSYLSFAVHLAAMVAFGRHLSVLIQQIGVPITPPFFGPLPQAPPRLGLRLRQNLAWRIALHLSLAASIIVVAVQLGGFSILRSWAKEAVVPTTDLTKAAGFNLIVAVQSPLPIIAMAALIAGPWLALRRPEPRSSIFPLSLAGMSPILAAFPTVAFLQQGEVSQLPIAAVSLATYAIVQEGAARKARTLAAVQSMVPGEASTSSAARSLGLALTSPSGPAPTLSQILSSAAAWFSAAALLAAFSSLQSALPAAYALVWGITAGALQLVAVSIANSLPRPAIAHHAMDIGQEALSHDVT